MATIEPHVQTSVQPLVEPHVEPSAEPSVQPFVEPSAEGQWDQTVDVAQFWAQARAAEPPVAPALARGGIPPEVWIVGAGLVALAVLIVYPLFDGLPELVKGAFSGDALTRAFATLFLEFVVMFFACAVALVALAVGLLRGSKVAQLLTCVLAGLVSLAELIALGKNDAYAARPASGAVTAIVLASAAIVVLISTRPAVRAFFATGPLPLGVTLATVVNVYVGSVAVVDGLLLAIAGSIGQKYVWIGLAFGVVGMGLLAVNGPLRGGRRPARLVTLLAYAGVVAVLLGFAGTTDTWSSPSTLVPVGMVAVAALGLTVAPSSQAFFAEQRPAPAVAPITAAGLVLALVLTVAAAGLGFHASSSAPQYAAYSGSDYPTDEPTYEPTDEPSYYPTSEPTDYATDEPVAASTDTYSWTITESLSDGSTAQAVLSVGDPQAMAEGISSGDFTAGSGCDLTDGDDAVVPMTLTVTNGADESDFVGITFGGLGSKSYPDEPDMYLYFEAAFSDTGATCDGQDGDSSTFGLRSTYALSPSGSVSVDGFFDIAGFYANSTDTDSLLRQAVLTIDGSQSFGDSYATVTDVSGPGATTTGDGSWQIDLDGA